jgi:hypothetical protein
MSEGASHIASIAVKCPAENVFVFMADATKLHRWSFGTWRTEIGEDGLVTGTSIFDGARTYLRIDADRARLAIDYRLGGDPKTLVPRIVAKIVPGQFLGLDTDHCVLTLIAWRSATMDDERWRRLTASHEFEVVLIKSLLENDSPRAT